MRKRITGILCAGAIILLLASAAFAQGADKSIVVEIGGKRALLSAEQYTDGSVYVAFYKSTGQMTSYKIYSADAGTIEVLPDETASYAKIMWWNQDMLPNCEAQIVNLKEQNTVAYHIDDNDQYLQSLKINNPNPTAYYTEDGLTLSDLNVAGYNFKGWYTAQTGGERVTKLQPGERGNKTLYAHWEKLEFTVSFASDMVPVDDLKYRAGDEKVLPKLTLDKYTFVGWTDNKGKLWTSIPSGTTGNLTLYANWASNRNKAEAVKKLGDPLIFEDSQNGRLLFTYEIGSIKNVPLFTILNLNCVQGMISTTSRTETEEISATQATQIARTISNATTNTSTWTLSNDWNKITEISEEYLDRTGYTKEETETRAKSETSGWRITTDAGSSGSTVVTDGKTHATSNNNSHSSTTATETKQTELKTDHWKAGGEVSVGFPVGVVGVGISGSYEQGGENKEETENKTTNTGTAGWSNNTADEKIDSTVTTNESYINTSTSREIGKTVSESQTVSNTMSREIAKTFGYGESYAQGGSNSEAKALETSNAKSDEHSSALSYFTSKIKSTTTTFESSGKTTGDYRLVRAGTVHVFAVVGYDIAKQTYFTYTYNVLDDETEEYLDYSFDGTFNDYETGILPFEVPYFVNEYVENKLAKSEGLELNPDTGIIEDYTPNAENPDKVVVIPSYMTVDNNDGTVEAIKIKGIKPGLFKNNKDIVAVQLGNYVTEIPVSAFEGCSSLKYILAPGVTKIGNRAFYGCTSLRSFDVPKDVETLGTNAFGNAPNIKAAASNKAIALSAASSGAKNITLDISEIPDSELGGMELKIGNIESFELQGKDKEYRGLSLVSDAAATTVNGVTFTENTKVPLTISSENVTLNRVTADCVGYAMILKADTANLRLNRNVNLISSGANAIVTKNLNLSNLTSGIVGRMTVSGNLLVCDTVTGENYLTFTRGSKITINEEEYENYISSHNILFDANGGTVAVASKMASLNMPIGELPVPSRDYHRFAGWFTQREGGEQITAETMMTSLTDFTVYAHWTQAEVSAWVPAADLPANAEVVDRKWTYTLTSTTTSGSSELTGWEKYNTTWVWGDWSGWMNNDPGSSGDRQTETRWVDTSYNVHEYHYYAWSTGDGWIWDSPGTAANNGHYGGHWHDIWVESQLPYDASHGNHIGPRQSCCNGMNRYYEGSPFERNRPVAQGYTQWHYRDKIYTYHYRKNENMESATNPTGQANVSNVREYVQYRNK